MKVVEPGGWLLACCNHHRMSEGEFVGQLRGAAERAGRRIEQLSTNPPPGDFPTPHGAIAHLKSAWLHLGEKGMAARVVQAFKDLGAYGKFG